MDPLYHPGTIKASTIHTLSSAASFSKTVPSNLKDLSHQRYEVIPSSLSQRNANLDDECAYVTKDELIMLMDWKLKHGTFRPKLAQLIASNTPETVKECTSAAFTHLKPLKGQNDTAHANVRKAVNELVKLRGVGPATASLILSCVDPLNLPFFSDELFRWTLLPLPSSSGPGWERKIKYSLAEYMDLLGQVDDLRGRVAEGATACEVERAAAVIYHYHQHGKLGQVGDNGSGGKGKKRAATNDDKDDGQRSTRRRKKQ